MKKLVALLLCACSFGVATAKTEMARITRFEGVEITGLIASSAFRVEVYQGSENRIEVEFTTDLADHIDCTISDGVVKLGLKKTAGLSLKNKRFLARVYMNDLQSIKGSGATSIKLMTPIDAVSMKIELSGTSVLSGEGITVRECATIKCSGSSKLKLDNLSAQLFRCNLSGASSVRQTSTAETANWNLSGASKAAVTGSGGTVTIEASGTSKFTGRDYNVGEAILRATSASEIVIGTAETLSLSAASAATILYKGSPVIKNLHTSSAGKVKSY